MKIEPHHDLGLSPEEMITIFNRMYLDVWEKNKNHIPWNEKEPTALLIPLLEVIVTAVRDATMLTLYENNERIVESLEKAGIFKKKKTEVLKKGTADETQDNPSLPARKEES